MEIIDAEGLVYVGLLAVMLVWLWSQKRRGKIVFRFGRVLGLALICSAGALPFVILAYFLSPSGWDSPFMMVSLGLAFFGPYFILFAYAFRAKRKREKTVAKAYSRDPSEV